MPLSRFKTVVMLCPHAVTGGPEAMHQAAFALNSIGVTCYMVYAGTDHPVAIEPQRIVCSKPQSPALQTAYARYNPRIFSELQLGPDTLVVFPEAYAQYVARRERHGVALWWLSVDNAFRANPKLADRATRFQLLGDEAIIHLHQSAYAREWLRDSGFQNLLQLEDYTNETFTDREAYGPSPQPWAAYNAAKGADLAASFFDEHPEYQALPLRKFTKPQLRDIFAERLIYIDFGHFPGKDRLPREAAISGSIVFTNCAGAGAVYEDFPIPDVFKFEAADVTSGELHRRLQAVIAEPARFWAMQADFRSRIRWEKAQFFDTLMRLWGIRRMP